MASSYRWGIVIAEVINMTKKLTTVVGIASILAIGLFGLIGTAQTPLDPRTVQAMLDSINDEYRAHAFYQAVIDKFGPVLPFANIVQAEAQHIDTWKFYFAKYGVPVPADTFLGNVQVSTTIWEACEQAAAAELANAAMYEQFLTFVKEPDLRWVMARLRDVSLQNHLPAFQQCGMGRGPRRP
jgi:hypothetical protein